MSKAEQRLSILGVSFLVVKNLDLGLVGSQGALQIFVTLFPLEVALNLTL